MHRKTPSVNTTQFFGALRFGEVILLPNHGTPPHMPNHHAMMMWRTGTGTSWSGTLGFGRRGRAVRIWQPRSFLAPNALSLSARFRSVKRSLQTGPTISLLHSHSSCDLRPSRSWSNLCHFRTAICTSKLPKLSLRNPLVVFFSLFSFFFFSCFDIAKIHSSNAFPIHRGFRLTRVRNRGCFWTWS